MNTEQIQIRYSVLAEDDACCLSCGGAINHSKALPGEVCVDLGSGRGTDVLRLADEVGETGFVYGVDVSDGMLKKAEKNAEKLGVTNVRFVKSELEDIKIETGTVNRILKKGGRFVVSDIYSIGEVPQEYRTDPQAVAECWAGATTKHEYLDTLTKVGFKDIEILEESAPYPKGKIQVASFTIAGKTKCCN
jgi:ubiquinone/menaquinone biosynthesis C-methylase UbiE